MLVEFLPQSTPRLTCGDGLIRSGAIWQNIANVESNLSVVQLLMSKNVSHVKTRVPRDLVQTYLESQLDDVDLV